MRSRRARKARRRTRPCCSISPATACRSMPRTCCSAPVCRPTRKRTCCSAAACTCGASAGAVPQSSAAEEAALWKELADNQWPADVLRLADDYLKRYPTAKLAGSAEVAREGAGDAVKALRSNEVRLYRSAFVPKVTT